ncbi:LCP family protein [Enterococcus faecium]|uniref:LCP family glycopolymer transferase n=1 Tax=Enterococcus faecium TaxID=1352 RepID=UPI003CC55C00
MKKIFLSILVTLFIIVIAIIGYAGKFYFDVKETAKESYEVADREFKITKKSGEPFSVLLLGTDSGDIVRSGQGRTDTMIVVTVNPDKETTTLVNISRDTFTDIIGYGKKDKINHAYAYGGVPMAISTTENLLDISIDYYVQTNLKGIKELVNFVGGVDVNNSFSFNYEDTNFPIGKLYLDGEKALKYCRMRYDDPNGDYGRQNRQIKVLTSILNKLKSLNTLRNYKGMLKIFGENMKTDISWEMIQTIFKHYRPVLKVVKSDQLQGTEFIGNGTTGEQGISYQKIEDRELTRIQNELKNQLK